MGVGGDHNSHNNHKNNHMSLHLPLPYLHFLHNLDKKDVKDIPKGCLAVLVGQGEHQQRFVIPVIYFNHPLFMQLLKDAEEEYGFEHKGPITIPCQVEEFRTVQDMIDREISFHHHHHHHNNYHVWCFKV
ncbi:hypothetical protein Lal_00001905 [Lupinus albus]|uniref:Putative small auxin-up RNA n=1 Tax=Lupinus albus TaxID=3870 RepID=A0A6A5P901_LUPAL|nr:putative small auxin-up RNA [Lupinus albus]KAF1893431.1 hypothetical protein Lal_00001905 [Lupinus albus]